MGVPVLSSVTVLVLTLTSRMASQLTLNLCHHYGPACWSLDCVWHWLWLLNLILPQPANCSSLDWPRTFLIATNMPGNLDPWLSLSLCLGLRCAGKDKPHCSNKFQILHTIWNKKHYRIVPTSSPSCPYELWQTFLMEMTSCD